MPFGIKEARYLMRLGGSKGLGFRRCVDLLSDINLKYKWRDMRGDYSAGYRTSPPRSRLTFCPLNRVPSYGMRGAPLNYIRTRYRYTMEVKVYNKKTETFETIPHMRSYRRLVTRGQAERATLRTIRKIPRIYRWKVFTCRLIQVEDITKY